MLTGNVLCSHFRSVTGKGKNYNLTILMKYSLLGLKWKFPFSRVLAKKSFDLEHTEDTDGQQSRGLCCKCCHGHLLLFFHSEKMVTIGIWLDIKLTMDTFWLYEEVWVWNLQLQQFESENMRVKRELAKLCRF